MRCLIISLNGLCCDGITPFRSRVHLVQSCPSRMLETLCRTFYPQCIHHGPTKRACRLACIELEEEFRVPYESYTGEDWPLGCNDLPDSIGSSDGSCTEPDGGRIFILVIGLK